MDLILVRHGLPVRIEGANGAANPPLSPVGEAQAQCLAAHLAHEKVDAIYSSPMRRAHETAAPTAATLGLDITVEDRIAEFDQSSSSYVPAEEAKAAGGSWQTGWSRGDWPADGESFDDFHERVIDGVESIIERHAGQRVVAFCHAGVIARYVNTLLDGPEDTIGFFYPLYTSVTRLAASRRGDRGVVSINETGHLVGSDLPTGRL